MLTGIFKALDFFFICFSTFIKFHYIVTEVLIFLLPSGSIYPAQCIHVRADKLFDYLYTKKKKVPLIAI